MGACLSLDSSNQHVQASCPRPLGQPCDSALWTSHETSMEKTRKLWSSSQILKASLSPRGVFSHHDFQMFEMGPRHRQKGSHVRRSETLATHLSSEAEVKRETAKDPRPRKGWRAEQAD